MADVVNPYVGISRGELVRVVTTMIDALTQSPQNDVLSLKMATERQSRQVGALQNLVFILGLLVGVDLGIALYAGSSPLCIALLAIASSTLTSQTVRLLRRRAVHTKELRVELNRWTLALELERLPSLHSSRRRAA